MAEQSAELNGGRITTFTGKHLDPFSPRPGEIDVRDIAHALALKCRFNGHCRGFYSVAEHSVRVSNYLRETGRKDRALAGLMHDAAEAYLADLGGPIKGRFHVRVGAELHPFDEAEEALLREIARQLGFAEIRYADVREADRVLLATEARDLFGIDPRQWGLTETPLPEKLEPWRWETAEARFLASYEGLRQAGADQG